MRLRFAIVAVSLLAVVPGLSIALGLGPIQLKSGLNAPLNAEIELTATPEELATLKAQIASRETFSRYGLDYPSFLTGIEVKIVRAPDGRDVITLTSSAPMVEPFATILVDATWARGRNLREYTVLFDPPVFAPEGAREQPVAAPVTGGGDRSGVVARPEPAAPAAPAPVAAAPAVASSADGSYVVRNGDSLSAITRQQYGQTSNDRAMIAIYRENPAAFNGNINELRAGAVLRLPDSAAISAVDPGEAAAEVRRQSAAWSPARASEGAGTDPRLRLVPPAAAGGSAGGAGSAENKALQDRVTRLEADLAESRRLLELRNAELARLQGATAPAKPPATTPAPAPAPAVPAPAAPATAAAPPATSEPIAEAEPEVAPPAPIKPKPVAAPVAKAPAGPSLLDRLKALWIIPVGLLVLAAALLGLRALRRRGSNSFESSFGSFGTPANAARDLSSDTFPMRKPVVGEDDRSIVVEESGTRERPALANEAARTVDFDEPEQSMTGTGLDAGSALDQGDPLAEADFHMAYGLYDQAADLVRLAIEREPTRRDLKLKLLEVFFVWGNKDQFLQSARNLADSRDVAEPGEWEKILIMGKQLAPEDPLFSATYSGPGPSAVDLNLEGGQNHIDFDLHGEPSVEYSPRGGMDLDLGSGARDRDLEGTARLDFSLDDPARGGDALARTATTRQMAQPGFGDDTATQRIASPEGQEGPTVEQPQLKDGGTLRQKIDAQTQFTSNDQTAELALDDLGLDLGRLDTTRTTLLDESRLTRELASPDAPTLVAGLDDTSRRMIAAAQEGMQPTELLPLTDVTDDVARTSRVPSLDFELNYDAEGSAVTGKHAALGDTDFRIDSDTGTSKIAADGERTQTQRIHTGRASEVDPLTADLEPVTMSEVGTKLDLARAYMDMGDPDGARNILNEVLQEGSVAQKQEAQRLIDSIPG
jgi:pilus assembly protein FimV